MTTQIELATTPNPIPLAEARDDQDRAQQAWIDLARELGPGFAARAEDHDQADAFVEENYAALRRHRFFSAQVPSELGGGGASFETICACLVELARHCPSTALALSMHQHLIAANVWKYRKQGQSEPMLRMVAERSPYS